MKPLSFPKRLAMIVCLILTFTIQNAAALSEALILGGEVVGIQLFAEGPIITEIEQNSPAAEAGLRVGDMIVSCNGIAVHSAKTLSQRLQSEKGCLLGVLRNEKRADYYVRPKTLRTGCRLGVRVRDTVSGIGTVTFIDPEDGSYGALGHGVTDSTSGKLMPISTGFLVPAEVAEVKAGKRGAPGQLVGAYDVSKKIGTVERNTQAGIFGTMQNGTKQLVFAGSAAEVHLGAAELCCTVRGGTPGSYSAEIMKIDPAADNGRNLMLRITDPELLSLTGGIVQGMSGSPILQDGKLIGAVTHVLVNDPKKGYGILLEKMRSAA